MKFRTEIKIPQNEAKLTYIDKLFFIGSCFTKNIGNKLIDLKFHVELNPFGVLYNPLSVRNSMDFLLKKKEFAETDLHYHNDLWFSFYHHSSFSHFEKNKCLENINERIEKATDSLKNATFLFITFGTSYVYQLKKTGEVVSNCHKLPAKDFKRSMIPSCEIYDEYVILFNNIRKINPQVKIVFTLSPVRHLKDGFAENMHSKANLLMAIHQLVDFVDDVYYFPAYEIMMDDLRDYRFYSEDLVHPNDLAVEYIWEKFQDTFIDSNEKQLMKKVQDIVNAANHKPFNPNTDTFKKFAKTQLNKIAEIKSLNSFIDFSEEEKLFNSYVF